MLKQSGHLSQTFPTACHLVISLRRSVIPYALKQCPLSTSIIHDVLFPLLAHSVPSIIRLTSENQVFLQLQMCRCSSRVFEHLDLGRRQDTFVNHSGAIAH